MKESIDCNVAFTFSDLQLKRLGVDPIGDKYRLVTPPKKILKKITYKHKTKRWPIFFRVIEIIMKTTGFLDSLLKTRVCKSLSSRLKIHLLTELSFNYFFGLSVLHNFGGITSFTCTSRITYNCVRSGFCF